jgi:hypothetical protein
MRLKISNNQIDFIDAYIEAALWSSTDKDDKHLDENYCEPDLHESARTKIKADCLAFLKANESLIKQAADLGDYFAQKTKWNEYERAGHDFWFTRNHHGAGFWDRNLGEVGDKLTEAAKAFGECTLIVGDDGKIYLE